MIKYKLVKMTEIGHKISQACEYKLYNKDINRMSSVDIIFYGILFFHVITSVNNELQHND